MQTHSFSYFATILFLVMSLSLSLSEIAQSDDCATVDDHLAISRIAMGGDFDDCSARIVGPDQVCPGTENPYFVVGEARNCSTINWGLREKPPANTEGLENYLGSGADGPGACDLFFQSSGTEQTDGKRVTVKVEPNCPGKFDLDAQANENCKCGKAEKNNIPVGNRKSICEGISDPELCKALLKLKALNQIAETLGENPNDVIEKSVPDGEGNFALEQALKDAARAARNVSENDLANNQSLPPEVEQNLASGQRRDVLSDDVTGRLGGFIADSLPIGNSRDLDELANLLEEFSKSISPCNNEVLREIADQLQS